MPDSAGKTVEATWVAPFEASLPDGTVLVPNETVARIPEAEAQDSTHWRPKSGKAAKAKGPTVKELREQAEALGLDVPSGAKAAAIKKLIAEAKQPAPEVTAAPENAPGGSPDEEAQS